MQTKRSLVCMQGTCPGRRPGLPVRVCALAGPGPKALACRTKAGYQKPKASGGQPWNEVPGLE
eukprot:NODE_4992_length_742_cov_17.665224_g4185_i0.p4 GENE.NODE_4992_length_742_cov_17.665224_g4185_i0~~NODE_4992_length_742_cov_17.665224_g4185_i0.p4  ORF type:complete len:63 (-),score=8.82 NODE_4992_length_742_cov_17.665224_g4185_i0:129-317(-)